MCRICVLFDPTGSDRIIEKAQLMHLLMLYGSADPYQHDGWGITNGKNRHKRGQSFHVDGYIDPNLCELSILGHIRSASANTELGDKAAHPYVFRLPDQRKWYGVHNGQFNPTYDIKVKGPDTDTYKAFSVLNGILSEYFQPDKPFRELLTGVLPLWLGLHYSTSTFALAFHVDDDILLFRSEPKTLYASTTEQYTLVHTSGDALLRVGDYAEKYMGIQVSLPVLLSTNTLISLRTGLETPVSYTLRAPQPMRRKKKR